MKQKVLIALSAILLMTFAAVVFAYTNKPANNFESASHCKMMGKNYADVPVFGDGKDSCCGMPDCCQDGKCSKDGDCCKNGCCGKDKDSCPMKKDKDSCPMKMHKSNDTANPQTVSDNAEDCCKPGADCCKGGACCHKKG